MRFQLDEYDVCARGAATEKISLRYENFHIRENRRMKKENRMMEFIYHSTVSANAFNG